MDGEHHRYALATKRERNQASHRVVGVHHFDAFALLAAMLDEGRDRTRKRGEARSVVHVRRAVLTVDAIPIEQARQVEQHELRAGSQLPVEHVHFAAVRKCERRQPTRSEQAPGLEARGARGGHGHPVPELTEGLH